MSTQLFKVSYRQIEEVADGLEDFPLSQVYRYWLDHVGSINKKIPLAELLGDPEFDPVLDNENVAWLLDELFAEDKQAIKTARLLTADLIEHHLEPGGFLDKLYPHPDNQKARKWIAELRELALSEKRGPTPSTDEVHASESRVAFALRPAVHGHGYNPLWNAIDWLKDDTWLENRLRDYLTQGPTAYIPRK